MFADGSVDASASQKKNESQHGVLSVSTTTYPMDLPPALLPSVRDNFPKAVRKIPPKSYTYNLMHKKDKEEDSTKTDTHAKDYDSMVNNRNGYAESQNILTSRSPFQFSKTEPVENHNSNYRPIHGLKYVQNYKSMLKQRGVRYQELFGHSPRKPEERAGLYKELQTKDVNPRLANKGGAILQHAFTKHEISSDGIKLPKISVAESKECSLMDMSIKSKENSIPPLPLSEMEENWDTANPDDTIMLYDDYESRHLGHLINSNLNDVLWRDTVQSTPVLSRRTPHRKGKLGDLMTPKYMEELLEDSTGLLKFEDGLGYPYGK